MCDVCVRKSVVGMKRGEAAGSQIDRTGVALDSPSGCRSLPQDANRGRMDRPDAAGRRTSALR